MKKLIAITLILAMIVSAAALADLPDISGLTNEELIELNHQIQMRLFSEKLAEGVNIPVGTYTIGEDIPAGSYRIETSSDLGVLLVTSPDGKSIGTYLLGTTYDTLEIGKIVLEEGQTFELSYCSVTLLPYSGLF